MRRAIPFLFALFLLPMLHADQEPVPSFQLAAPPTCTDPQQNYSCNPTVSIQNWTANPNYSWCQELECHLEYCFGLAETNVQGETLIQGCMSPGQSPSYTTGWVNSVPSTYTFGGDGAYTLYGEYAVVARGDVPYISAIRLRDDN